MINISEYHSLCVITGIDYLDGIIKRGCIISVNNVDFHTKIIHVEHTSFEIFVHFGFCLCLLTVTIPKHSRRIRHLRATIS